MKKISTYLLHLGLLLFISQTGFASQTVLLQIEGLVCPMCAQGIETKMKATDQFSKIDVNMDTKQVSLVEKADLDDKDRLTDEALTKLIVDAGYKVVKIERNNPSAPQTPVVPVKK